MTGRITGTAIAVAIALTWTMGCGQRPTTTTTEPAIATSSSIPTPPARPSASSDLAPACTTIGQPWVSPDDAATLVCVPAGSFLMGAADDATDVRPGTTPRHLVRLRGYWIDRTEVTNAAYAQCVAAGKCPERPDMPGTTGVASTTRPDYYHDPAYAHYPVLAYTSEEAATYCACMGRRLPTEAEFERAAGGPEAAAYPWGDTLDCDHASYLDCTADTTDVETPAGGASAFGALNLAGNVWEWVSDWYSEDYYARSPTDDPQGPDSGKYQVRRGGGFSSLPRHLLVTARASGNPAHYFDGQMGFRCATDAASP